MFTNDVLKQRLKNVQHFSDLPDSAIENIVASGQVFRYEAGSIIFREGETCAGLFVLFKGQVHLYKFGLQGQETIVAKISPVIMFNEVPVIDGGPNPVTAVAVQDCVTWWISYDRFQVLMDKYHELGTSLLLVLASRNRLLFECYEDLLSRPVLARVAKIILDISNSGTQTINRLKYTNPKMAALSATVPEAISRSIKIFKTEKIIEASRTHITVLEAEKLSEKALIEPLDFGMN